MGRVLTLPPLRVGLLARVSEARDPAHQKDDWKAITSIQSETHCNRNGSLESCRSGYRNARRLRC